MKPQSWAVVAACALALTACGEPPASDPLVVPVSPTPSASRSSARPVPTRTPTAPPSPSPTRSVAPLTVEGLLSSPLTLDGLGPATFGMPLARLKKASLVTFSDFCESWVSADPLAKAGVHLGASDEGLRSIMLKGPQVRTLSGAYVGMRMDQVRRLYPQGGSVVVETDGNPYRAWRVRGQQSDLFFLGDPDGGGDVSLIHLVPSGVTQLYGC